MVTLVARSTVLSIFCSTIHDQTGINCGIFKRKVSAVSTPPKRCTLVGLKADCYDHVHLLKLTKAHMPIYRRHR